MSATYNAALPTPRDRVRLLLGDVGDGTTQTEIADALLQDETIDAALAQHSFADAVVVLATGLIARVGQEPDHYAESGGLTLDWSRRLEGWQQIVTLARAGQLSSALRCARPAIALGALTGPDMSRFRSD